MTLISTPKFMFEKFCEIWWGESLGFRNREGGGRLRCALEKVSL